MGLQQFRAVEKMYRFNFQMFHRFGPRKRALRECFRVC